MPIAVSNNSSSNSTSFTSTSGLEPSLEDLTCTNIEGIEEEPESIPILPLKHVVFCPLAAFIPTVDSSCFRNDDDYLDEAEGEKRRGRPRLTVRRYSMETPSIKLSWSKVVNTISTSLQPLLSPSSNSNSGGGVCSFSGKSYFEDSGLFIKSNEELEERQEEEAESKLAVNSTNKLSIVLPSFSRKVSIPLSPSTTHSSTTILNTTNLRGRNIRSMSLDSNMNIVSPRSILKSPERRILPPLDPIISHSSTSNLSPLTISISERLPQPQSQSESTVEEETIPISPCRKNCSRATEFGKSENWKELWSRNAKAKWRCEHVIDLEFSSGDRKKVNVGVKVEEEKKVEDGGEKKWEKVLVDELKKVEVGIDGIDEIELKNKNKEKLEELNMNLIELSTSSTSPAQVAASTTTPSALPPNTLSHTKQQPALTTSSTNSKPQLKPTTTTKRRFSISGIIDSAASNFISGSSNSSGGRNYT